MEKQEFDLLLKGGRIIDPDQGLDETQDIVFSRGKVVAIGSSFDSNRAQQVIDVNGFLVVPGLIDLHTHVYWGGTALSVQADPLCMRSGVTTFVDTGSAGAGNFHGFKAFIINQARARILSFLHIAYPGIPCLGRELGKEFIVPLTDPLLFNVGAAKRVALENPNEIVGIKVRAGVGSDGPSLQPVYMARNVAERIGKPMMVHLGGPPPQIETILPLMRPGDIVTHSFRPYPNSIINENGQPILEVLEAKERGVILDVGHGAGGFSFNIARAALASGLAPNVISTDVHVNSINGPVFDLPTTLSKFLALGMSLSEVIAASTLNPAKAIGWDDRIGHLKPGAFGDATVLELKDEVITLSDSVGEMLNAEKVLRHIATIIDGNFYPHSHDGSLNH